MKSVVFFGSYSARQSAVVVVFTTLEKPLCQNMITHNDDDVGT